MVRGSCLCRGIRFEVTKVPIIVLCHCSICRKSNGSAFDAGGAVPSDDVRFTEGEELIRFYESSPGTVRAFCSVCGSRAPGKSTDGKFYYIPAGLFDDDPDVRPAHHIFVGSKAPWWEITDDLPQFEKSASGYGSNDSN